MQEFILGAGRMTWFIFGIIVGANVGTLFVGLCLAAKEFKEPEYIATNRSETDG